MLKVHFNPLSGSNLVPKKCTHYGVMQLRLLNKWKVAGFLEQHKLGLGHESSELHRKAWNRDAIEAPGEY